LKERLFSAIRTFWKLFNLVVWLAG